MPFVNLTTECYQTWWRLLGDAHSSERFYRLSLSLSEAYPPGRLCRVFKVGHRTLGIFLELRIVSGEWMC
jgi:hypothetical protein